MSIFRDIGPAVASFVLHARVIAVAHVLNCGQEVRPQEGSYNLTRNRSGYGVHTHLNTQRGTQVLQQLSIKQRM